MADSQHHASVVTNRSAAVRLGTDSCQAPNGAWPQRQSIDGQPTAVEPREAVTMSNCRSEPRQAGASSAPTAALWPLSGRTAAGGAISAPPPAAAAAPAQQVRSEMRWAPGEGCRAVQQAGCTASPEGRLQQHAERSEPTPPAASPQPALGRDEDKTGETTTQRDNPRWISRRKRICVLNNRPILQR